MEQKQFSGARISISPEWDVLGPFQIGTREVAWGSDPLEKIGGFRSLEIDQEATFHSSLATDGAVKWTHHCSPQVESGDEGARADLSIAFHNTDWKSLKSQYGWMALQYQCWARGSFDIGGHDLQTVAIYTDNILEYWIDGEQHFGGDFYSYRRAPLVLSLQPGRHRLEIRLIRDVRAMGGVGEPLVEVKLEIMRSNGALVVEGDNLLVPDMVDGELAGKVASVPVRNESRDRIEILSIESLNDSFVVKILDAGVTPKVGLMEVAPGQSRPLRFWLSVRRPFDLRIALKITYTSASASQSHSCIKISYTLSALSSHDAHKITFLHPSGIVSYAILRPPSLNVTRTIPQGKSLPVLLNLHGAGLEVDCHQVRHMLDPVPDLCAWVLYPSGVTSWCGDDWHTWGSADVEAAVVAILEWIDITKWSGPSIDTRRWLITGHSNGGQGTWHFLSHQPDKLIAAAPVSGYMSIQAYVPYQMWNDADPRVTAIIEASLIDYRHELLLENFAGIPIMQQHGSSDDNVPVFHSRRMSQLISETGFPSKYVELPGRGHWFNGIMTTPPLKQFYDENLQPNPDYPELPQCFSILIACPGSTGSRGGIIVDQLESPDRLGRIDVDRFSSATWRIRTSNIHRWHFSAQDCLAGRPSSVLLDKSSVTSVPDHLPSKGSWFVKSDGFWKISSDEVWQSIEQRYGRQLGTIDAILRSTGPFIILPIAMETMPLALEIARNLFQYFAADAIILDDQELDTSHAGNIISLCLGSKMQSNALMEFPIMVDPEEGLVICNAWRERRHFDFEKGLGVAFLKPLPNERLELMLWGYDIGGLRQAARLVPMLTGVGQPDFVVVGKTCAWKGAGGVLAMGFFDYTWNVSRASFLT